MNRIDRLSAILIQLQSKKIVKAHEIADRFDISLRTVYRDVRALEEAGIPIGAEAGVGYFLMEGYSLPPVKFSKEEAGSLLMASKLAEKLTDRSIKKHLSDALLKIRSALKLEEKDYLESIENSIEVIHLPETMNNTDASFPDHFLTEIQNALAQKKVINFDYFSNYNGAFTNRNVEPLSLCYYSRHWHLIGYCQLRNDLRDFRSDRIMKLSMTAQAFEPSRHSDYKDYVTTIMQGSELQEVTIRFTHAVTPYINEQKYFMGYVESTKAADYEEMKFMTADHRNFAHWLLQFSDQATIVAPQTLKDRVILLLKQAHVHHSALEHAEKPGN
ncbi:YafY family transcriptional regulator [Fulvivirga sp. M361]|uniref:helix-turn-helix transcriptional regulator n=1 Tax=Fulvivirga sp. M361 TaxID=2594266 RepID=UPI00117B3ACD|nr:YafY family protein [Fulvivirga sp. M361]TRX61321.1 YafY family transcriptional regulator [Fulvivirga sp. M361]